MFGLALGVAGAGLSIGSGIMRMGSAYASSKMQANSIALQGQLSKQRRELEALNEEQTRLSNMQDYNWARQTQAVKNVSSGFKGNSGSFTALSQLRLSRTMTSDRMSEFNTQMQDKITSTSANFANMQAQSIMNIARADRIASALGIASNAIQFMPTIAKGAESVMNDYKASQTQKAVQESYNKYSIFEPNRSGGFFDNSPSYNFFKNR